MAEQTRLFLGLIRPPRLMGLPVVYAMLWLFGSALAFLWLKHWSVALFAVAAYPVLWKAADWDERFVDVVTTALQVTPPTRNRKRHGGNSYAP